MTHAMVFLGVNLVDGKPNRWKVENSWGDKAKKADVVLSTSAKNSDKKIEIGVKVVGDDYVAIVAKAAAKAAK